MTTLWLWCCLFHAFQLTRSRGAWQGSRLHFKRCISISTHTLTWSVTVSFIPSTATFTISTHTLTWSVTARHRLHRCRHIHFNSHAHVERDQDEVIKCQQQLSFQLTRSRGAWPSLFHRQSCICYFNSHAHVERDLSSVDNISDKMKFQLTRSRGAWRQLDKQNSGKIWFQLTRSRGAWHMLGIFLIWKNIFQLTRSRGAWQQTIICNDLKQHFNSHAHVERDILD